MTESSSLLWRSLRVLLPPIILAFLIFFTLREPITWWLHGDTLYDQEAMKEWIREARVSDTLPELIRNYVELAKKERSATKEKSDSKRPTLQNALGDKREEIQEHLKALGNPPTKMYPNQLPLFPIIYRLAVSFDDSLNAADIVWDSQLPRQSNQYQELELDHPSAKVYIQYHLHAFQQRELLEQQELSRRLWLGGLGIFFALLVLFWVVVSQVRERWRDRQRLLAQQQINEAERLRLQEKLLRQEAEIRQEETERQNLELKSQIFANIGIMAGSYAHNIKNLLVRPNDLLRRCIDEPLSPGDQGLMLKEVKHTLGTVTERLQQILQTVRRDPTQVEKVRIDLNAQAVEMVTTWSDLGREKWKLDFKLDLEQRDGKPEPLWIEGDLSHIQQAFENLLFNARDATFEMRNHLREEARQKVHGPGQRSSAAPPSSDGKQALIAAAGWKGLVTLRTRRRDGWAILEVQDNGIGMTDEIRRRCAETHFTTKRDNALFAGLSAGMGLGLSFVSVILEHQGARMEIDSAPLKGTTFRILFPAGT